MNWDVILWCCMTIAALVVAFFAVYYVMSAKALRKRRIEFVALQDALKPGKVVLFSGGIKGKIVRVKDEYLDIEVAKELTITISKLAVSDILN